jgi:hypothetical protein
MKRKPINIMAALINALNSYPMDQSYSINQIHEDTDLHWNTVHDYIKLINLVKYYAPDLNVDNDTNEVIINKHSPYFRKLEKQEQLILHLFLSKAFNKESALKKEKIHLKNGSKLNKETLSREFIQFTSNGDLYLTLKGKFKAHGVLSSVYENMVDFIENKTNPKEKSNNLWLLNFYEDGQSSPLKTKKEYKKCVSEQKKEKKQSENSEYITLFEELKRSQRRSSIDVSTENIA